MKKLTTLTSAFIFSLFLAFGMTQTASAQVYSYNNGYNNSGYYNNYNNNYQNNYQQCNGVYTNYCTGYTPTVSSYYYTSGCYTYYYNGYTRSSSVVSYNCQTQNQRSITYSYSPTYYTYGYHNGSWYPGYSSSLLTNTGYNDNNYYTNYSNNNYSSCYWQNGYQICY